jgi:hypothetical protein
MKCSCPVLSYRHFHIIYVRLHRISNLYIFPLILLRDIFNVNGLTLDMYRIRSVVKVETYIIAFGLAVILVIMYDQTFKTDVIVSITNVVFYVTLTDNFQYQSQSIDIPSSGILNVLTLERQIILTLFGPNSH